MSDKIIKINPSVPNIEQPEDIIIDDEAIVTLNKWYDRLNDAYHAIDDLVMPSGLDECHPIMHTLPEAMRAKLYDAQELIDNVMEWIENQTGDTEDEPKP